MKEYLNTKDKYRKEVSREYRDLLAISYQIERIIKYNYETKNIK